MCALHSITIFTLHSLTICLQTSCSRKPSPHIFKQTHRHTGTHTPNSLTICSLHPPTTHSHIDTQTHRHTDTQAHRNTYTAQSHYLQSNWPVKKSLLHTRTATHCNTLRHTATHCNTLQHTATRWFDHYTASLFAIKQAFEKKPPPHTHIHTHTQYTAAHESMTLCVSHTLTHCAASLTYTLHSLTICHQTSLCKKASFFLSTVGSSSAGGSVGATTNRRNIIGASLGVHEVLHIILHMTHFVSHMCSCLI